MLNSMETDPTPTSTATTLPDWLRIASAIGAGVGVAAVATGIYIAVAGVVGSLASLTLYVVVPAAVTALTLRRSRWWVRLLAALGSVFVGFIVLIVVFMIAMAGMQFAAVG